MNFYYGIVENRNDPLKLGRCQVRVVGLHTHDKNLLPTSELPWATPMQPVVSAAMNGIGHSPIGPVEGTSVVIIFADEDLQQPILLGTLGGIPSEPIPPDSDDSGPILATSKTSDIKLTTVASPTTGRQLTFYDKNNPNSRNLTSKLKPNMKVIGYGIRKETYIVSIDSGTQITVNNDVKNYGENIISFEDPPTNLDEVNKSKLQNYVTSGTGNVVTDSSGNPIKKTIPSSQPVVKENATNNSIPTIPPPKSVKNQTEASNGIKALISACDKVGLTTKEQKCSLLGIAGGESAWVPKKESHDYSSAARLKQIYSFLTDEEAEQYTNATKKGISKEQFFSVMYGTTKRGKNFLGNQNDTDGGKYYGRGFIQLTGRGNYQRYQDQAKAYGLDLNIVDDPDSLDSDLNVSALVAALYVKDRVPKGVNVSDTPGYFYAAKKAVGVNVPDIAARKLAYYEYFYGSQATGSVEKDAGAPPPEPPKDTDPPVIVPAPSKRSVQTGSVNMGFRDPNNKYPLKEYVGEPDTNRLSRGIIDGTIVPKKDKNRKLTIPRSFRLGTWDQPETVYGSKYPYNKVFESESGHIQEFDDTPGYERIHTYHRTGTFTEVDPNGTQINCIVGDNFIIMERNGCVSVSGECNITVEGNTNIFARSDANIQVSNNANIEVGNNLNVGVAKNVDMVVGQDISIKAVGDLNIEAQNINVKSREDMDILALASTRFTSNSSMELLTSGNMRLDYGRGDFGNGATSASVEDIKLTAPEVGQPVNPIVPFLIPPERQFEEKTAAETPEDWDTPEGRKQSDTLARNNGVIGAPIPSADESAEKQSGGSNTTIPVDCKVIFSSQEFPKDYRLSKNFTLGMLITSPEHRLVDQMLKEAKDGPEILYTKQQIVCNLAQLCQNILEPMLDVLPNGIAGYKKQWQINSGYRLKGVIQNESATSDHCKGRAVDIGILLPDVNNKTYEIIQQAEKIIPYDQLILEYRYPSSCWIHVGYRSEARRKMAFTMVNDASYKKNDVGQPYGFYLLTSIPPKNAVS
jgi:predicted chitinase